MGARLLGVVVNNVDFGRWGGFGKYETRYGYSAATYVPRAKMNEPKEDLNKAVFTVDAPKVVDTPELSPDDRPVDDAFASEDD